MSILASLRERFRRHRSLAAEWPPGWDDAAVPMQDAPTATMPAPAYEPHGIDTPETLAALREKAEADAMAAQESAQTEQWGTWDEPGTLKVTEVTPSLPPPPPLPYPSVTSRIMVGQITYPDPSDLSPDKDRHYRDMLRRVGVATGTHTSLEDTGMWALPALPPGDGTGVRLAAQEHGETGPEVAA